MVRLVLMFFFVLGFVGCSASQGLGDGEETGICSVGEARPCVCDGGTVGSQACDSFTKTWSVCLCAAEQGFDGVGEKSELESMPLPSLDHQAGSVVVGGAELSSENYRLKLVVPAAPTSGLLESESFRLRLGTTVEKENP